MRGGGNRAARKANALLASALTVEEAPVIAPSAPAPGSPIPVQQAGTYPTEQAKLEAALPALMKAADAYPNTDAGITARYHAAGALAALGRYGEAEQRYQEVVDKAGNRLYGRTAKLGLADVQVLQGKVRQRDQDLPGRWRPIRIRSCRSMAS